MLGKTLRQLIRHGRLTIIRPDGDTEQFGELTAAEPRPDVAVRLKGALTWGNFTSAQVGKIEPALTPIKGHCRYAGGMAVS